MRIPGRLPFALVVLLAALTAAAQPETSPTPGASQPAMPHRGEPVLLPDDPFRAFDFWTGEWDVKNKQLRAGSWIDSGEAIARIDAILDGNAILEQWTGNLGGNPLIGFSLRGYDPEREAWPVFLNWHGGRPGGFSMMVGRRDGERLELLPPNSANPTTRYTFSMAHTDSCQWDQATRKDDVWSTNWIMQFTRRDAARAIDASSLPIAQPPQSAERFPETRKLDRLIGSWKGKATLRVGDDTTEGTALARVSSMIEGFGLLQFLDTEWGGRHFAALGHDSRAGRWVAVTGTNRMPGVWRLNATSRDPETTEGLDVKFEGPLQGGERTMRWRCTSAERCLYEQRDVRGDDTTTLTVDFTRSE